LARDIIGCLSWGSPSWGSLFPRSWDDNRSLNDNDRSLNDNNLSLNDNNRSLNDNCRSLNDNDDFDAAS